MLHSCTLRPISGISQAIEVPSRKFKMSKSVTRNQILFTIFAITMYRWI